MPTILKAPLQQESEAWFDRTLAGAFNLPVPKRRHVDDLHALPRQRQMRVICLGMPRTGTFSLFNALTRMGFKPYHMAAAMTKPAIDFPCWEEAIRAKYHGDGKPFEREDFDKILGDYDAILDAPGVMFPDELLKAYPEAKVIITERPVEGRSSLGRFFLNSRNDSFRLDTLNQEYRRSMLGMALEACSLG